MGLALLMQMQGLAAEPSASVFSTPELVKDIQAEGVSFSGEGQVSRVGNRSLFYACDRALGTALWISDDSPQGWHLLRVLDSYALTAPQITFWPMDAQGRTFFSASEGGEAQNLWVTDGTVEGTRRLTLPIDQHGGVGPREVVVYGNGVRFRGRTTEGSSLWISEGTPEGTYPLVSDDDSYHVENVLEAHGGLYFFIVPSYGYAGGAQLWWSSGQPQNFTLIKTFPDSDPEKTNDPGFLHVTEDRMYLSVPTLAHGRELWVTEGTEKSTRIVKEIAPGKSGSDPDFFANLGGRMLFTATTPTTGRELYVTDGTSKGTVLLKNLGKGRVDGNPIFFAQAGNQIYLRAQVSEDQSSELCVTDGTPKGTFIVSDKLSLGTSSPALLGRYGEEAYFTGYDTDLGSRLWVVGGTHAVPLNISALRLESNFVDKIPFISWDTGFAFTIGSDARIWVSDGTAAGLRPIVQSSVKSLAKFGSFLGFNTETYVQKSIQVHHLATGATTTILTVSSSQKVTWGREIRPGRITFKVGSITWATDGTPEGTFELGSSQRLEFFDDHAWFTTQATTVGTMLTWWRTDGTQAGTVPVYQVPITNTDTNPYNLKSFAGHIWFNATDGTHGWELWRSDGTEVGTHMVVDIVPGGGSSSPEILGEYAGLLYFTAFTPAHGREIWRTDGTPEGTFMLQDIRPGTSKNSFSTFFAGAGGKAYFIPFVRSDNSSDYQLWVTDGTVAGTLKLKNSISRWYTDIGHYIAYQDRLAYTSDGNLWLTDGTETGTVFHASGPANVSGAANNLTVMDGQLFWMNGYELMRSNGTPGGATRLGIVTRTINTLLARPPTSGEVAGPGSWVLFIRNYEGLYRHISGEASLTLIAPSNNSGALWLCGSTLIYANEGRLWGSNGHANAQVQLMEDGIQSILTTTPERIYFTRTNKLGTLDIESIRPDGTDRRLLATGNLNQTCKLAHVEQGRVFFTLGTWLWETSGTPATTRRVPTGQVPESSLYTLSFASLGDQLYLPLTHPVAGRELHRLPLPAQPLLSMTSAEGAELALEETGPIELPARVVSQTSTRRLTLRNPGLLPLTEIAFTSAELGDFILSPATLPSLAAGASLTIEITFTPQTSGQHEAEVTMTAQGATGFTRSLSLRGRALRPEDDAEVMAAPQSQLLLLGQPATFKAELLTPAGVESSYWQRLPGPARMDTGSTLTLPATQVEDIGRYAYHAGTPGGEIITAAADLGLVLATQAEPVSVPTGYSIQLQCYAQAPPGTRLSYQWLRNQRPLLSVTRITGSQSPTLTLLDFRSSDAADYECIVTMHSADRSVSLSHGVTRLRLMEPPNLLPIYGWRLQFFIGQKVHYQLPLTFPADNFAARGLPPGLNLSPTGLITGRPTKALPVDPETEMDDPRARAYQVLLVGANAAGVGEVHQIAITILPIATQGNYVGLLPRHADLAGGNNLGNQVQLTIADAGSFSGRLTHGGKVYRFTSPKMPMDTPPEDFPTGYEIPISLGRNQATLTLTLYSDGYPELQARLRDDLGHVSQGTLGRQRAPIASEGEVGTYSIAIMPREEAVMALQVPPGIGHLLLTLSKTGIFSWKGKLADGTALTGSTLRICPNITDTPKACIHLPLYKATGSLHGELLRFEDNYRKLAFSSDLTWLKAAETGKRSRIYPDGIPLHDLVGSGHLIQPLRERQRFWDLPTSGYPLRLTFTGEGMPEEGLVQHAGITDASRIRLDPENQTLKSFSIDLKTRAFKGSFQMLPPDSTKPLSIPFQGALTDDYGGGFFLIPEAPESGPLNPQTAPLRSGRVIIELAR